MNTQPQKNQKRGPGGDGGKVFIFANKIKGQGKIKADGGDGSIGGKGGEVHIVVNKGKYSGEILASGGNSDIEEIRIKVRGREYTLNNNSNKYERAKLAAGTNATEEQILAYYDKLAGLIKDESGQKVENGRFWEGEKGRLAKEKIKRERKVPTKDIPLWLKYLVAVVGVFGVLWVVYVYFSSGQAYLPNTQVDQDHTGSGDNVAGDKIINYGDNDVQNEDEVDKRKLFEGNIYNLLPKARDDFPTTIARGEFLKNFPGMVVESDGFITDVYGLIGSTYSVIINESSEDSFSERITCYFDESWGQKLASLDVPQQISFRGVISNFFVGTNLEDCEIL